MRADETDLTMLFDTLTAGHRGADTAGATELSPWMLPLLPLAALRCRRGLFAALPLILCARFTDIRWKAAAHYRAGRSGQPVAAQAAGGAPAPSRRTSGAAMVKRLLAILLLAVMLPAWAAQDLLLEAELDLQEVHVHAQAVYRLRFLHAVDARDVQLAGPQVRLADLRRIGEDKVFETERDGRRYRAHERKYAVFPFASGTLELAGAYATGRIPAATASLPEGWRPVRLEAPPRTLTVLPVDIQADGVPWLPAKRLTLTEQWTTVENGVHRRTLRIEAAGVEAAQLPELDVKVEGMGVLPGPARLENRFEGERNIAVREQTYVLMPTKSGLFTVPPLQLRWWNVDTDSERIAGLPGRTLLVGESATSAAPTSGTSLTQTALGHLWVIAAASLASALLFAALRSRHLRMAWRLRQACRTADAHAVRDGLLEWAASTLPDPPQNLGALAERIQVSGTRDAVLALDRSLYGPQAGSWDSGMLAALVSRVKRDARRTKS
jgi:hypothetical protein